MGRRAWWVALAACALAVALGVARRQWILTWFHDAPPQTVTASAGASPLVPRSARVRVVVLDGLTAAVADELPRLSEACGRGLDVRVDVGFPTVSLPVQHVLWTGLTQAQSGIEYRVDRIDPPVAVVPAAGLHSVAVAESHRDIVHSFAFDEVIPAADDAPIEASGSAWREEGFEVAALDAMASDVPLAFVHVLRIDEAGHGYGADSDPYRSAAHSADAWLGRAIAATGDDATWFVLADHGHRAAGGHGGAEPEIRIVRACVFGPGVPAEDRRPGPAVPLVDLHRELVSATGATPNPASVGRSLAQAPESLPLPHPSTWAWVIAIAVVVGGVGGPIVADRRAPGRWPWWLVLVLLGIFAFGDAPTLSNPIVWPKWPVDLWRAASPGLAVFSAQLYVGIDRVGWRRALPGLGGPAVALGLATFVLALLHAGADPVAYLPALVPIWTAQTSVALAVLTAMAAVAGFVAAVRALERR